MDHSETTIWKMIQIPYIFHPISYNFKISRPNTPIFIHIYVFILCYIWLLFHCICTRKRKLPAPVSTSSGLLNSSAGPQSEYTVVGYYFCGESIPYRTTVHSTQVTLGQFKQHISKRGIYRYVHA